MIIKNDSGESQVETQIRKNVNKYTNIIIPVIYRSHSFSIDSLCTKVKVNDTHMEELVLY